MKRQGGLSVLLAAALYVLGCVPVSAQSASGCQYVLGFQTLHDLLPSVVGSCVDNQASAANGDAQQHSANGLLAWRKADNWTAFTDGFRTWINGPAGVQQRLNTQRYSWEGDAGAPGTTIIVSTSSGSAPPAGGCQTQVSAPSSFDPASRTFVYGPNGLALTVPADWCAMAPIKAYVEGFSGTDGSAAILGPQLGEAITLSVFSRPGGDGDNKAQAYFAGGTATPQAVTVAGLGGWAVQGFNGPQVSCSADGLATIPVGCLPSEWRSVTYFPWRPGDATNQLAIGADAPSGYKDAMTAVLSSARFVR